MTTRARGELIKLLERRIGESGLSNRAFAEDVLVRDERTIRRWLSSESPIPGRVVEWLEDPKPAPWPVHERIQELEEELRLVRDEMLG